MSDMIFEEYSKQFDEDKNSQRTAELYRYDELLEELKKLKNNKRTHKICTKSLAKKIAFKVKKKT